MCCMWSTYNPPDIIEGTEPFCDIETAFDICIDETDALDLIDIGGNKEDHGDKRTTMLTSHCT